MCACIQSQVARLQNSCCKEAAEARLRISTGGPSHTRGCPSDLPIPSPSPSPSRLRPAGLPEAWRTTDSSLPGAAADERRGAGAGAEPGRALPLLGSGRSRPPGWITAGPPLPAGSPWSCLGFGTVISKAAPDNRVTQIKFPPPAFPL